MRRLMHLTEIEAAALRCARDGGWRVMVERTDGTRITVQGRMQARRTLVLCIPPHKPKETPHAQ